MEGCFCKGTAFCVKQELKFKHYLQGHCTSKDVCTCVGLAVYKPHVNLQCVSVRSPLCCIIPTFIRYTTEAMYGIRTQIYMLPDTNCNK